MPQGDNRTRRRMVMWHSSGFKAGQRLKATSDLGTEATEPSIIRKLCGLGIDHFSLVWVKDLTVLSMKF